MMSCYENYYGDKCNVYCKAERGSNFTCSATGRKICFKNWNGEQCDVYGMFIFVFLIIFIENVMFH